MTAIPFNTFPTQNPLKNLEYIVAQAGGSIPQLNLFTYLLTPFISYSNKDNNLDKGILFDHRAATSLLFLFPPQIQATLSIFFYLRELEIEKQFSKKFILSSNIQTPYSILQLHQGITELPLSFFLMSFLSLQDYKNTQALKLLLGFKNPDQLIDILYSENNLYRDLDSLFNLIEYSDQSFPFLEKYKEIAVNNNRLEAAVLIAESFNYSFSYIQSIANLCELWLLQNSSI